MWVRKLWLGRRRVLPVRFLALAAETPRTREERPLDATSNTDL